jgi:hypothetical protein
MCFNTLLELTSQPRLTGDYHNRIRVFGILIQAHVNESSLSSNRPVINQGINWEISTLLKTSEVSRCTSMLLVSAVSTFNLILGTPCLGCQYMLTPIRVLKGQARFYEWALYTITMCCNLAHENKMGLFNKKSKNKPQDPHLQILNLAGAHGSRTHREHARYPPKNVSRILLSWFNVLILASLILGLFSSQQRWAGYFI